MRFELLAVLPLVITASLAGPVVAASASAGLPSSAALATADTVVLERAVRVLVVGQQVRLRAHVESDSGEQLGTPIAWRATSSSYVSLAADGRITGIRPGRVTIIAVAGDESARFEVRVIENTIGWLTITANRERVRVGEPVRFRFEALDRSGGTIADLTPTWSLAPGPGTVSEDGEFVALAPGTHVVYAHIADRVASAAVTVIGG